MPRPLLLDTCAAIWLMNGDPMTAESRRAIKEAVTANAGIYVSPISAWEIGTLNAKNRLQLSMTPKAWFDELLSLPSVRLAQTSPHVMIDAAFLPGKPPKDPADRILAATSRAYNYTLVTRDGELLPYSRAGHLRAVNC